MPHSVKRARSRLHRSGRTPRAGSLRAQKKELPAIMNIPPGEERPAGDGDDYQCRDGATIQSMGPSLVRY